MTKVRSSRIVVLGLSLLFFGLSTAQSRQFSSNLEYQVDALVHTQGEDGQAFHLLGWLLNNNSYTYKKHALHLNLSLNHGGEPSADIVGDLQTFSNLEAGELFGLYEAYYQFGTDSTWFRIGQVDINRDFAVSQVGTFYTHSSFGIDPVLTINTPAPTFPVAGLSVATRLRVNNKFHLQAAIFDGQFAQPSNNRLRFEWTINRDQGLIYLIEPEFKLFEGRFTQKLGFYHHSGKFQNLETGFEKRGLTSAYLIGDIDSLNWHGKSLKLFYQFNKSFGKTSLLDHYFGFGFTIDSPFGRHEGHTLGLAVAHASINTKYPLIYQYYTFSGETAIELSYEFPLTKWLSLQPYIHHIRFHTAPDQKTPFVFSLRVKTGLDILR